MAIRKAAWHCTTPAACCTPSQAGCRTSEVANGQVSQGDSTLQQKRGRVKQTVMPLLVDLYSGVHNSYEEVKQKQARLRADLATTDAQLDAVSTERARTVQWMLQCAGGPYADGHDVMHAIAEHMQSARQPAAAASFLEEAISQAA